MPTYEYRCPEGHEFELFQKMADKPRAKCPVCGKPAARQISGGAGLHFKGSGFYITDYGKDGKGPRKAEPAAEGGSGGGETADKPAAADKVDKPAEAAKPDKSDKPARSDKPDSASKSPGKKAKS